ncbi:SWIM zinc finger family protein [Spirillospora sp. NPDC050679]
MAGWWSRRLLAPVESFAGTATLARGRTFSVDGLKVGAYEVTARVRGAGTGPYEVALGIDAIAPEGWLAIEAELAGRAVYRARLLAGELPPEVELVFAEFGVSLFPRSVGDLHAMCSCPDWGDLCEHAAAALHALGAAFDDDPFLVLEWNGRTREDLLRALRRAPAAEAGPEEDAEPLAAEGFWAPPTGLARLRERRPAPPVPPGFLLRVAVPPPVKVRRRDLAAVLEPAYEALTPDIAEDD